jgi:HEAT repeat protein
MTKRCVVGRAALVLAVLSLPARAHASRLQGPMGGYVRAAGTIVVANTKAGGERGRQPVLEIQKVIKGDPALAGQAVLLRSSPTSSADARLPIGAKGVAVLLAPGWQEAEKWPVVEVYDEPDALAALPTLARVYAAPTERERLLALRKEFAAGNRFCREQLIEDLRDMRDPANFDLITRFYGELPPSEQAQIVGLLGQIGDLRGVPTLIQALRSPDGKVNSRAAYALAHAFPGAPGVTQAFEEALARPHLEQDAARYLARYRPPAELPQGAAPREDAWTQAWRLKAAGKADAARDLLTQVLADRQETALRRVVAARTLLAEADAEERDRIRVLVVPLVTAALGKKARIVFARYAAEALRALRHPDCLEPLLVLLKNRSVLQRDAVRVATMAVRELGDTARQRAVPLLLDILAPPPDRRPSTSERETTMLQILWLGDAASYRQADARVRQRERRAWDELRPLRALADQKDEAAFLIQVLAGGARLPSRALEWIAFRLGDLRDPRGIDSLVRLMTHYRGWLVSGIAADALVHIGGQQVEARMLALLTDEDRSHTRLYACRVLFALLGSRSRDLARRMLREEDFGHKRLAIEQIGRIGTPEDLELLRPYCDYWKVDRQLQHQAMRAAAALRTRHNHDLNGPIRPTASF